MKLPASFVLLVLVFSVLQEILAVPLSNFTYCSDEGENGKVINLSIRSKRNESGDWVTSFALYGNSKNITDAINLDLKQMVTEKNKTILLQGVFELVSPIFTVEESNLDSSDANGEQIVFKTRIGSNIQLSNSGRTAERINPWDNFENAIVVTNRALKDNELFEVRLDKVFSNWAGSLEFGVTSKKPTEIPDHANFGKYSNEYAWFFGLENKEFPGRWNYTVGDRFGVKKTSNGDLQYFVNGTYVATSPSKIPEEVYGIVDLYANGVKATILNPP